MLVFVVFCNCLLAILNCYLAFRLWKIYRFLVKVTKTLTKVEGRTHYILKRVPVGIINRQLQTYQLRQRYQELTRKLQQLQKIVRLVNLGFRLWRRFS